MTALGGSAVRIGAALALAAVWVAPNATAVMPPTVDDALLPPARPPAPSAATEQTDTCRMGSYAATAASIGAATLALASATSRTGATSSSVPTSLRPMKLPPNMASSSLAVLE